MMRSQSFLLLLAAIVAPLHAAQVVPFSAEQMQRVGVRTEAVSETTALFTNRVPAQVVIPPEQERVVTAPQTGLVTAIRAAVGDTVKRGQMLAELESPELIRLQRAFLHAATAMQLARADLNRDRKLYKEGIIAERRFLETRSHFEQASATLEENRQGLALAGMSADAIQELEKKRRLSSGLSVASPIDGVVLAQMAVTGQRVDIADALYRVGRLGSLWLSVRVPLDMLGALQPDLPAEVHGCPDARARITLVGAEVDPTNQTALVRVEVTKNPGCLRPGQFVEVRLALESDTHLYSVPRAAVVRSGDKAMVFVQQADGFAARPVTVLGQRGEQSVVKAMLKPGERVAVAGLAAIKGAWLGVGGSE